MRWFKMKLDEQGACRTSFFPFCSGICQKLLLNSSRPRSSGDHLSDKKSSSRSQSTLQYFWHSSMASKRRGLSLEDKREKMLEFFYETQDFFLLKELEKMGPRKGVISQSVKDVVQSLVDDDMVLREKIGTSIYFWSLPSQAGNQLRQNRAKYKQDIEETKAKKAKALKDLEVVRADRKDFEDREARLEVLNKLEVENRALANEMERYAENDPEVWDRKRKSIKVSKDAVNRWTDNIFGLQKWCNDSFSGDSEGLAGLYAEVGITEDLDYVN